MFRIRSVIPTRITLLGLFLVSVASANSALPVITAPVVLVNNFSDPVEALGTLKSNESVSISANVTETVKQIFFEDGQTVKRGEILLTLEKAEEEAELKAAQALLDERRASYNRALSLQKQQALSTATLEERQALLSQTEGAIEVIQTRINDRIIRAPFDGVLGFRNISPGTLVRPGDLITTIDDLSRMKVDFDIPSRLLGDIRPGLSVSGKIDAFGDRIFSGIISTVNTQIDPITRTLRVRATLKNPDHLIKPGLLMTLTLQTNPRAALIIPEEAIIQKDKRFFVYKTENTDGKILAKEVQIAPGTRTPGKIEIRHGLSEGDQVIVHGLMHVQANQEVMIQAVEKTKQPLNELLLQSTRAK